ncbi:MAG TPA: DUF4097 family beta strand repeat-containing protein [Candidatus Binatia bacterium]|nr:DUF4097 family beta strand repeat-containing protein [Candidatus Binatia bacterium]
MANLLADAVNELDETVSVESGGTLFIDLDRGAVEVASHDANEVHVDARATGWGAWNFEFDLARRDNDVRVSGEMGSWLPWPFGPRVRVRVMVPRPYSVDARTRGGRITLANLAGRIIAETKGGSVQLDGAEGPVTLHTSGGAMRVAQVEGDVRVDTSGGAIEVRQVVGNVLANTSGGPITISGVTGRVAARTSGGRIEVREAGEHIDATTSGGSVSVSFVGPPSGNLETSGGSIEARFPASAGATLDAETRGGQVEIEPPFTLDTTPSRHRAQGRVNGGGASLRLRTSGGNIRVGPA